MSDNHFRSHFWPFHFRSHFCTFQIDAEHFLLKLVTKWPPVLDGTTMSIIELVRDIWMSNACVTFEEERSLNPSKVIALTKKL